jgi:hypothetical protein
MRCVDLFRTLRNVSFRRTRLRVRTVSPVPSHRRLSWYYATFALVEVRRWAVSLKGGQSVSLLKRGYTSLKRETKDNSRFV